MIQKHICHRIVTHHQLQRQHRQPNAIVIATHIGVLRTIHIGFYFKCVRTTYRCAVFVEHLSNSTPSTYACTIPVIVYYNSNILTSPLFLLLDFLSYHK